MLDLDTDHLFPLRDVPRQLPPSRRGKPVNLSTVLRWVLKGVRGVRLEAVMLGGTWYTSRAALREFTERLTARAVPAGVGFRPPSASRRASALAERQLEARGA